MTVRVSPEDLALLNAYRATEWIVQLPEREQSLRIGVPFHAAPHLPSAVVTAFNPRSELRDEQENEAANRAMLQALLASGGDVHPAIARSGDGDSRWDEPGYLVSGLSLDFLLELLTPWQQNAIVWVDRDAVPTLLVSRPGFCGRQPGDTLSDL